MKPNIEHNIEPNIELNNDPNIKPNMDTNESNVKIFLYIPQIGTQLFLIKTTTTITITTIEMGFDTIEINLVFPNFGHEVGSSNFRFYLNSK